MLDITNKQKCNTICKIYEEFDSKIPDSWHDYDRGGTIQWIGLVCMLRGNIKVDFK